jgi:hypothetical protein
MKTLTSRLLDLLERYEEVAESDSLVDPAAVCAGSPELLPALLEALAQLEQFERRYPLRPQEGPSSTLPTEPAVPAVAPAPAGYQIERLLGRGGMGVVYLARHGQLGRLCALKMILTGDQAGPDQRDRFLTEAQAIARLRHENIVQVFEIGEHEGHSFMALEFCEGGSLATKLHERQPTPRESAALVRTLALGMHAAHQARIIHRDLKPANILLAADGTPKVTDFGLAKKLDEVGQTYPGVIMGTPGYMPPEQARGEKILGPAVDIYALGAILYECLTGRPPFKAATAMETLLQVLHNEPIAVRQHNPSVPLDLETIVHKCLQKDPRKRYASAQELANDLNRFLNGEPVRARPVSAIERAWRWCRRNPAVALALAAVVVVLISASVVSALFALDASRKAAAAVAAGENLERKNEQLRTALEERNGALARTWLSPLAESASPLNDAEMSALTDLSAFRNDALAFRFLTEALRTPAGIRRLGARPAFTMHALVGLNLRMRAEVEGRLVSVLIAPDQPADARADVALAASELGSLSPAAAAVVAPELLQAMARTDDPVNQVPLARNLSAVVRQLEPREAVRLNDQAATILIQTLPRTTDDTLLPLLQALTLVAGHLESRTAGKVVSTLTPTTFRMNRPATQRYVASAFAAAAERLESREGAEAAAVLLRALPAPERPPETSVLLGALAAVTERLEARYAINLLTQTLGRGRHPDSLAALEQGLSRAAHRLTPQEAGEVAATLTQTLQRTDNPFELEPLAVGLAALAGRLETRQATGLAASWAATLTQAFSKKGAPMGPMHIAQGLLAVAACQPAREAAVTLAQAMASTPDLRALRLLAEGLSKVAVHLDASEAQEVASVLLQALRKSTEPAVLEPLTQGLAVVAARLETQEAAATSGHAASLLAQASARDPSANNLPSLVRGLVLTTARMEAREAVPLLMEVFSQAADAAAFRPLPENAAALGSLADILASLLPRLDGMERARVAAQATATLTRIKNNEKNPDSARYLAEGLAVLEPYLEGKEGARQSGQVAALILEALARASNANQFSTCEERFARVAQRLEGGEAAAILLQASAKTTDAFVLRSLARLLPAVAARLEEKDRSRVVATAAAALTRAMTQAPRPNLLQALAEGLQALALCLDPVEARPVAEALSGALTRTSDPRALEVLSQSLSVVAGRLEGEEGAQVAAKAVLLLLRHLARMGDRGRFPLAIESGIRALLGADQGREAAVALAATAGLLQDRQALLGVLPLARPLFVPRAPQLPDTELVELLKHPLCVDPARRAVLDVLGVRYQRSFTDLWDFVHFADDRKLNLDFTRPPRRP